MQPNINPKTGVAHGFVAANDLDPEVVAELIYGPKARDLRYEDGLYVALERTATAFGLRSRHQLGEDLIEGLTQLFNETYEMADEPDIEGYYEGVAYVTSWLGGACHFFIVESPHIGYGRRASPCVPGAGILNPQGEGPVECYTVPTHWWAEQQETA